MTLDGLNLEFPPNWTVGRFERLILARRDSRIGSLQISVAYRSAVRGDAGHEECRDVLASYASSPNFSRLGEPEAEGDGHNLFGTVTWTDERTFRRGWYRLSQGRLALALYQCHLKRSSDAENELSECEGITRTMQWLDGT